MTARDRDNLHRYSDHFYLPPKCSIEDRDSVAVKGKTVPAQCYPALELLKRQRAASFAI